MYKIFVLGVPHTITSPRFWERCGFTEKVRCLCSMLTQQGHEVIHLGIEGSKPECTQHIDIMKADVWEKLYGKIWNDNPNHPLLQVTDGPFAHYHQQWAKKAKLAIIERCDKEKESIVCITWGTSQWWASRATEQFIVEASIGYPKAYADFRVYESYAWLHSHLGQEGMLTIPKWYWSVIPLAHDPDQFTFNDKRGDDFLYFGRLDDAKGVQIACDAAKAAGRKIILCGYGDAKRFAAPHVEIKTACDAAEKRALLSGARGVFCPTWYVEPFGRVAIEAALSGAPVIATDWGAFTETIVHGVTGYRCRTMDHFIWAAKNVETIKPQACRDWAISNFSLDRIAPMYTEYFQSVLRTRDKATDWSAENPQRKELNWLKPGQSNMPKAKRSK